MPSPAPHPLRLDIPRPTLVVLCGPAGSGKSTFAARCFLPTQVVSSDACRALLADDPTDQTVSARAFALMHHLIDQRLALGRFTVADSTALTPAARGELRAIARRHDFLAYLLVFATPLEVCLARDAQRPRPVGAPVIRRQWERLQAFLDDPAHLRRSGFDRALVLPPAQAAQTAVAVVPPPVECDAPGPFDLIGPPEGCFWELDKLLARLGYAPDATAGRRHPDGRTAVFLGDVVGNGPRNLETARLVLAMTAAGAALAVPGDQDIAFGHCLSRSGAQITAEVERAVAEFAALPKEERVRFRTQFAGYLDALPPYLLLRGGRLAAVHAALPEHMQGRLSRRVAGVCLNGVRDGDWVAAYRGRTLVAWGGAPVGQPRFYHNTINLHQGVAARGALSALRVPEMEVVQVAAGV